MVKAQPLNDDADTPQRIRLDKWLWYARVTKTRALAQRMLVAGQARINGRKVSSASVKVTPGDVITLVMHPQSIHADVRVMRIVHCGTRRGPFAEARLLYEEVGSEPQHRPSAQP